MATLNQRTAYGEALVELGAQNPDIVVLDADLGKSTMGYMFREKYPERHFEMGIAEANMLSTAAGLALGGKVAFAATFAVFFGRAFDQIRQTISIGKLNVKMGGSSSGLSDFGDGSTHQAIEDIAIMRAIPGMTILTPVDANQTKKAVRAAVEIQGPVYIRVNRNDLPAITPEDGEFVVGKIYPVRKGSDVAIFAAGIMVSKALEAADALEKAGISASVINVPTIKPLDSKMVIDCAKAHKAVVTAEEHSIVGGLGSAIAETLRGESIPIAFVGVKDEFGQSAKSYDDLLVHYGLTAEKIEEAAKSVL